MHILLVDDAEKILSTLRDFLEGRGHRVHTAQSGSEALSLMGETTPDLVLCDIRLPGMDGITFLRTVRGRFPGVPIVVLTGDRELDTAVEAFRSGACDFLKKPIDPRELLSRIQGVVDGSREGV